MADGERDNEATEDAAMQGLATQDLAAARDVLATEADALGVLADSLDEAFSEAVSRILAADGRVICVGVGKSGHVARKIAATLSSTGTPAYFVHPTEASHGDLGMIHRDDVILALSRSGETSELDDLVQYAKRFQVTLIALTFAVDSALGAAADVVLTLPAAEEACGVTHAPTTSTTMSMALGDALAVALLKRRGFDAERFKIYHPGGKLGAMLKTAGDLMQTGEAVPLAQSGTAFVDALDEMTAKNLGCIGVTDLDGRLVGIMTDGDLRRMMTAGATPAQVDDAMIRSPISAAPSDLAASILTLMNDRNITQVFVIDEKGRPIGVLHMHDILRAGLV